MSQPGNSRSGSSSQTAPPTVLQREWVGRGVRPDLLWDLHGAALFTLACAMLGDESAAMRAVSLGMMDLYTPSDPEPDDIDETLQGAACRVHSRCRAMLAGPPMRRTITLPPLMLWIGEIAAAQRSTLALCMFGGHTYRDAAGVLDLSPEVVADLLTSGLTELGQRATAETEPLA